MKSIVHWGKYYPPHHGGIESATASAARGAAQAGYAVSVVCFGGVVSSGEGVVDGVDVVRAPVEYMAASQPLGLRYMRLLMTRGRAAQIVHLHAPNMLAALAAVLLPRRVKLVVHWHSDVIGKGALGQFLRPLEKAMLMRADAIIGTSQAYCDGSSMLQQFASKIQIIPLGVADQRVPGRPCRTLLPIALGDRLEGKRLILSVGRLVAYKGFDVLIDAASDMPSNAMVVIVGDGPLNSSLAQRIASNGLDDKVVLTGRVSDEVLAALFARADLFCLPSVERSEAFGVVLIEAMSHGLPVVATSIPGSGVPWVNLHEVTGLNVRVGDSAGLGEACSLILGSDALRSRFGMAARLRFEQEFDETIYCERVARLYSTLLSHA